MWLAPDLQADRQPQSQRGLEEAASSRKAETARPLRCSRSLGSSLAQQQVLVIRPSVLSGLLWRQHPWALAGFHLEPRSRWESPEHTALALQFLAWFNYSLPPGIVQHEQCEIEQGVSTWTRETWFPGDLCLMALAASSNGKTFSHLERLKSALCRVDCVVVVRAELTVLPLLSQGMEGFSPLSTHLY